MTNIIANTAYKQHYENIEKIKLYDDFDGDKENIHIPQNIQIIREIQLIANAKDKFNEV